MGYRATSALIFLVPAFVFAAQTPTLESVRAEIHALEDDLLLAQERDEARVGAANQLKKIHKLLQLQRKEIELTRKKNEELSKSLETLGTQKSELLTRVELQKKELRHRLIELARFSENDRLDASWLFNLEAENQKSYFLSKTLKGQVAVVAKLKEDAQSVLALELKIIEEKNRLDYAAQDLMSQVEMLAANEEVQREILRSNKSSKLEVYQRMRSLRESEKEIAGMLSMKTTAALQPSSPLQATISALEKGKMPYPLESDTRVLSSFGKSYNPKTNLLTFQKGVTFESKPSDIVRAVAPGKVVYSGPLKNYGLLVIVEHPGEYFTLYGQLGSTMVEAGQKIENGVALGKTSSEALYFELRNKNIAINPAQWFAGSAVALFKRGSP